MSAELPVLAVGLDLPVDVPALLPLVGLVPPEGVPALPGAPVPDEPDEPAPVPCACAMPIAPITASAAAIVLTDLLIAISPCVRTSTIEARPGARQCECPAERRRSPERRPIRRPSAVQAGVAGLSARAFAAIERL
ncbi:MAG: hypothetical protein JF585_09400 [Burkholderiales bacterium]|nr:hypothetical protein [Burkholderiales bacterium]